MKELYRITAERNGVYITNIAIAEKDTHQEDINRHYNSNGYTILVIAVATDGDIREADRKGMPKVNVDHIEENQEDEEMKEARTVEEIKEEIKVYFENNEEEYNEVIEDLDSYNGYLGDDRYFNMEDLDEFYRDTEPTELLTRAFYGHDADAWDLGRHEEKIYQAFNPNREYFKYNGYGNLISTNYKDYSDRLDNYFIDEIIDNVGNLYSIPDTIQELIEELEEIEA